MSRKSKVLSLSVSPEIALELDNMVKTKDKSRSEIFKEMFYAYKETIAEREWRELYKGVPFNEVMQKIVKMTRDEYGLSQYKFSFDD